MSCQRGQLVAGAAEAIFISTIQGAVIAFVPFQTKEDVDLFSHLEMHMRSEAPPLGGRAHLSYRSAYFPVKDCIDLDLCEQFAALAPETRQTIAAHLHIEAHDLVRKIQEMRHRVM
jgi:splicing factor 3B subunit 3